jgi:hypothetical protein
MLENAKRFARRASEKLRLKMRSREGSSVRLLLESPCRSENAAFGYTVG